MTKSLLLTAAVLSATLTAGSARAATVFSQNFSSSNLYSDYVGTGANQFDGITNAAGFTPSIVGGALSLNKTGATSGAVNRITPIASLANGAAIFQFDFSASGVTATGTTNDVVFQVGSGYTNVTGAEATQTYAQFTIDLQANSFAISGLGTFTGTQTISLCLNNTGSSVTFTPPGGGSLTLANDNFALYVGSTDIIPGGQVSVSTTGGTPTQDITQFKLRYPSTGDNGTIAIDNFSVNSVPEPSTFALLGAGAVGMILAARRRVA